MSTAAHNASRVLAVVFFEDHRVALLLDELPEPVERIAELAAQSVHWDQPGSRQRIACIVWVVLVLAQVDQVPSQVGIQPLMSTWAKKRQSHQESDSTSARPAALSSACAAQASESAASEASLLLCAPITTRRSEDTHRCRLAWRDDPARLEYVPPHVSLDLIASNHDRMRVKVERW